MFQFLQCSPQSTIGVAMPLFRDPKQHKYPARKNSQKNTKNTKNKNLENTKNKKKKIESTKNKSLIG